jgi:hypothetical protein
MNATLKTNKTDKRIAQLEDTFVRACPAFAKNSVSSHSIEESNTKNRKPHRQLLCAENKRRNPDMYV